MHHFKDAGARAAKKVSRMTQGVDSEHIPPLARENVLPDESRPTYIYVRRSDKACAYPTICAHNKILVEEKMLLILTSEEVHRHADKVCISNWLSGTVYRRHEKPTSNQYFILASWDEIMDDMQRTEFTKLCRAAGVRRIEIVVSNNFSMDRGAGMATNVENAAELSFANERSRLQSHHFKWVQEMSPPHAPPELADVDLYMVDRKAGREPGRGSVVCQELVGILQKGVDRGVPSVRNLVVMLEVTHEVAARAEVSVGAKYVEIKGHAQSSEARTDSLVIFLEFYPAEAYEGLRPDFVPDEYFLTPELAQVQHTLGRVLDAKDRDDCPGACLHVLNYFWPPAMYMLIVGDAGAGKSTFIHNILRATAGQLDPNHAANAERPPGLRIRVGPAPGQAQLARIKDGTQGHENFKLLDSAQRSGSLSIIDTEGFPAEEEFVALTEFNRFVNAGTDFAVDPLVILLAFDADAMYRRLKNAKKDAVTKLFGSYLPFATQTQRPVIVLFMKFDLIATSEQVNAGMALQAAAEKAFGADIQCEMVENMTLPTSEERQDFNNLREAACHNVRQDPPYRRFIKERKQEHSRVLKRLEQVLEHARSVDAHEGTRLK